MYHEDSMRPTAWINPTKINNFTVFFTTTIVGWTADIMTVLNISLYTLRSGGGRVWQRCRVSCVTRASNWYWLTVGQGLLSLQQVWVEGECLISSVSSLSFIFLSPLSLSFISSTISSISLLPFSGRRHKMTHKGWRVVKTQHNQIHSKK